MVQIVNTTNYRTKEVDYMADVATFLHGWEYRRPRWSEELINKETMVKKLHIDELRFAIMKVEDMLWILHRDIRALDAALINHIGKGGITRHPIVTDSVPGFMDSARMLKLDGMDPSTYATHDEVDTKIANHIPVYYTRDFYQDFEVGSFVAEAGKPTYSATFNIASLEREVGKGLKVFLVTRIRAYGSGTNDYFNGVMPLTDTIVQLPPDVQTEEDNNLVTVKAIFNQGNIVGHNYHMSGNVRLAARITCAVKGDVATDGGSAMITTGI